MIYSTIYFPLTEQYCHPTLPSGTGFYENRIEVDIFLQKIPVEQFPNESFLSLPFHENIDPVHRAGLPPRRFLCQSSPKL
ncbi:hypothetical protein [uncultured Nostoc sp.]|uniref:hypothetical protein n=1 Tax=uncultured Nostoc sp. TaxID=340711 RepID=UPI0035C9C763